MEEGAGDLGAMCQVLCALGSEARWPPWALDPAEEGCPGQCPALATLHLVATGQRGTFDGVCRNREAGRSLGVGQGAWSGPGTQSKGPERKPEVPDLLLSALAELSTSNCGMSLAFPLGSEWVSAS